MRTEVAAAHKAMAESIAINGQTQAVQTTILQRIERMNEKLMIYLVFALIIGLLGQKGLEILATHLH